MALPSTIIHKKFEIIHDENGEEALTPWPPLSRKKTRERGGKKQKRFAPFFAHFHKKGCEIIEFDCNTNK